MTCQRRYDWSLQAACLGLVGILAGVGCGGSSSKPSPGRDGSLDSNPFVPDGAPRDGLISVPDGARSDAPQGPVLRASPGALPFGEIDGGQTSPPQTVTVTNTGVLTSLTPTVDVTAFVISGNTCAVPAATCTISVVFSPPVTTVSTPANGTLTVAPGITVSLSGTGTPPRAFSATASAIPATVLANQPVPLTVTVLASGPLSGLTCVSSSADLTSDPTKTTCTGTMVANVPCAYGFTFKSATAGPKSDTIVCSAGVTVRNVSVTTNVVTPASLTIAPNPGVFSTGVGTTSQIVTFSVGNVGGSASGTLTTAISGANAGEFSITSDGCGALPLDPRASCTIQVVFKPTTPGANKAATITVTDATPGSTPATAALSGNGTTGATATITGTGNLGSAVVGKPVVTTLTVTNSGGTATGPLTVAAGDPQFVPGTGCNVAQLAPGATCTVTVTFTPTSAVVTSSVLTVTSGGTVLGTIQISGTGTPAPTPPALSMTPAAGLNFGKVAVGRTSATQSFTVTNTGGLATGALTVVTAAVGGGTSRFTYTTTCAAALAPGDTCQVVVTYKPTVVGSDSATFKVGDGTYSTPERTAAGTAVANPGISITCPTSAFGDTVVGQTSATTKVCTVSNDSASPLATGTLTFSTTGDFATIAGTTAADCSGKSLAPGDQCTTSVVFKPTAKGSRTGSIDVSGANGGSDTQALSGTGLAIIEIQEFTLNNFNLTPVSTDNPAFPYPVSAGATSDTTVILAIYVRGAAGRLTVAATDFTTIAAVADFKQGTAAVDAIWPGTAAHTAVAACVIGTTSTAVVPVTDTPYCTMVVSFTPQSKTPTQKTGTVTASGATAGTDTATVLGTAAGPISITPSTLTFDKVAVGAVGTAMTLTVCNSGTVAATRASYAITGTNRADFEVTLDEVTGATIAANGTACVHLALRLAPAAGDVGALSATVTVSARIGTGTGAPTETDTTTLAGTGASGAALTLQSGDTFSATPITGTGGPVTVTVRNSGGVATGPLTFSLPAGSEFTMSGSQGSCAATCPTVPPYAPAGSEIACGTALAPNATCTLRVWFTPTAGLNVGPRKSTLSAADSNSGALAVYALTADATSQITAPASATVGPAAVGDAASPITNVTIRNAGGATIGAAALGIGFQDVGVGQSGASLGDFTAPASSNTCTIGVVAGGTCTVGVRMVSSSVGTRSTTMVVTNATNGQTAKVVLTGTVGAALLEFTPATAMDRDFGTVRKGTGTATHPSTVVTYTVVNVGGLTSGSMTFDLYNPAGGGGPGATKHVGDFSLAGSTCVSDTTGTPGTRLPPGGTCDIKLAVIPETATTVGALSVYLVVTVAAPGTAPALTPHLTATVVDEGTVTMVESTSLKAPYDFGTHSTAQTAVLAIYNNKATGTFDVSSTQTHAFAQIAGSVGTIAEFTTPASASATGACAFATAGGTATLNPGDHCTFNVLWTPVAATIGARAVTLTVGSTVSMNLYARVGAAVLRAAPSSLSFGNVDVAATGPSQTVVVTNIGDAITSAAVAATKSGGSAADRGDVTFTGCTATIPAGGSCSLVVTVIPTTVQAATTVNVTVSSSTTETTGLIPVTWTSVAAGLAPVINGAPATLNLGSSAVLATSDPSTITLTSPANHDPTGPLHFVVTGDFAVQVPTTTGGCGDPVHAANGLGGTTADSCTLTVTFTPSTLTTPGKTGTLTITAPYLTGSVVTNLTGTAVSALSQSARRAANSTEDSGAIGGCTGTGTCTYPNTSTTATTFYSETFTFQNASRAPATGLLAADLTATTAGTRTGDPTQFKIVYDTCSGSSVNGNATCLVTVRFQPTSTGDKGPVLLTVTGTPGNSASVTLTGATP